MRRRDCILLQWRHVDLKGGFIVCRAHKTDELLQMPIFAPLRAVMEGRPRTSKYVFPEAAAIFLAEKDNRNFFLLRLKKILAVAGIDYDARNDFHSGHVRLRKASLSGWHAFKATFITMALNAGVPVELLKKAVGNKAVEVVLENYYAPSREHLSRILSNALPSALTGQKSMIESPRELLQRMDEGNWREIRALMLSIVK